MKRIFLAGLMAIAFIAPSYAAINNDDIQKAIDKIGQMSTPAGGGGLDVAYNDNKLLRNVNTINFTGNGVTVTKHRKNIEVNISGGSSPIIGFTIFTEAPSEEEPDITTLGDRWFNTDTGILYTAITGASGFIWVQL
jgi:hypothetical protein